MNSSDASVMTRCLVEGEQPLVRDGDAVGIAREICEHCLGAGEGRFGADPKLTFHRARLGHPHSEA